jgi:hypothetical protein
VSLRAQGLSPRFSRLQPGRTMPHPPPLCTQGAAMSNRAYAWPKAIYMMCTRAQVILSVPSTSKNSFSDCYKAQSHPIPCNNPESSKGGAEAGALWGA